MDYENKQIVTRQLPLLEINIKLSNIVCSKSFDAQYSSNQTWPVSTLAATCIMHTLAVHTTEQHMWSLRTRVVIVSILCYILQSDWSLLLLVNERSSFHCKQDSFQETLFYNFETEFTTSCQYVWNSLHKIGLQFTVSWCKWDILPNIQSISVLDCLPSAVPWVNQQSISVFSLYTCRQYSTSRKSLNKRRVWTQRSFCVQMRPDV